MRAHFLEKETNNFASKYIEEHYNELVKYIIGLGIKEKATDMLNDCYINMVKKEMDGNSFEPDEFGSNAVVYVKATLKKYALNDKYQDGIIEIKREHGKIVGRTYAACADEVDSDDVKNNIKLDAFQEAYRNAANFSEYDDIDSLESIREQIQYVIGFSNDKECNLRVFIEKFDEIASMKIDKDVLVGIQKLMEYNDELKEAFLSIFEFRKDHRDLFDMVLATV